MDNLETYRDSVRKSLLPELDLIKDAELRDKVVEAWALALSETEFRQIEDMKPSGAPLSPPMKNGTHAHHIRGVARIALAIADALEEVVGPIGVNRDVLVAGAILHDVGKPFEFSPRNQERWRANPALVGYPSMRHPIYGAHLAMKVGLPESIVHIIATHCREGNVETVMKPREVVRRSLEGTITRIADGAFWAPLDRAGLLDGEMR